MTRKTPSKKPSTRKTKQASGKTQPAKKTVAKSKPAKKTASRSKRQKMFVVQRKVFGVYGDTQYTPPDRVFVTKQAAQRYADEQNRELVALGWPFEQHRPGALIKGDDQALCAVVEKMGLQPPTRPGAFGIGLDWAGWWVENYFNLAAEQRNALCQALDKFEWFEVQTTTLE